MLNLKFCKVVDRKSAEGKLMIHWRDSNVTIVAVDLIIFEFLKGNCIQYMLLSISHIFTEKLLEETCTQLLK